MPNFRGYLALRRAVFEHVRDGRLTHAEALAYIYIATQADTRTGVWVGSSGALAGELCYSERLARSVLEALSRKTYLRRFPMPGRHYCYPILVNKYQVTDGEHKGERLNATASESLSRLVFEKIDAFCEQAGQEHVEHSVDERASQRIIKKKEERQNPSFVPVKPPSPAAIDLVSLLKERILGNNPTARITKAEENRWAKDADLMMTRDSRADAQIRELIEWSQKDSFWKTIILSMKKLRDKFDQLTLKRNENNNRHHLKGAVAAELGKYSNIPVQRVSNI